MTMVIIDRLTEARCYATHRSALLVRLSHSLYSLYTHYTHTLYTRIRVMLSIEPIIPEHHASDVHFL